MIIIILCISYSFLCRNISKAKTCLMEHYEFCDQPGQLAINRTSQLVSNLNYYLCDDNPLADEFVPECVDVTRTSTVCNLSAADVCAEGIHKAFHNPFMNTTQRCRLAHIINVAFLVDIFVVVFLLYSYKK